MSGPSELPALWEKVKRDEIAVITSGELKTLLDSSELLREEDTLVSGKIRIMLYDGLYIFQEKSIRDEYLVRLYSDVELARNLYKERMELYEKMWNGCGCKINYYE